MPCSTRALFVIFRLHLITFGNPRDSIKRLFSTIEFLMLHMKVLFTVYRGVDKCIIPTA